MFCIGNRKTGVEVSYRLALSKNPMKFEVKALHFWKQFVRVAFPARFSMRWQHTCMSWFPQAGKRSITEVVLTIRLTRTYPTRIFTGNTVSRVVSLKVVLLITRNKKLTTKYFNISFQMGFVTYKRSFRSTFKNRRPTRGIQLAPN